MAGLVLTAGLLLHPVPAAAATAVPPIGGAVVRGFDPPAQPWLSGHRGVDLLGKVGEPVLAVMAGRVTYSGTLAGRGVVVVSHGACAPPICRSRRGFRWGPKCPPAR